MLCTFSSDLNISNLIFLGFQYPSWTIRVPSSCQKTKMFGAAAQFVVILEIVNIHMHKGKVEGCGTSRR